MPKRASQAGPPVYRDMLAHYGVTALPCRVRDPNRKGKVESGVQHAQRKLRGLRFERPDDAQAYLDRWEANWADTRIHGTTKRQVATMFAEEQPYLQPLPAEPFRYYQFGHRTVHLDGAVEVAGAYYHLPPGHIGRRLSVQWDALHVRILEPVTGALLREHLRQKKGHHRMRDEDRPTKTPVSTVRLLARAATAGASIGIVCQTIHRLEGEVGVRRRDYRVVWRPKASLTCHPQRTRAADALLAVGSDACLNRRLPSARPAAGSVPK